VVGRQETVVQKNRVKALDGDWNALQEQNLRLSVLPAHERNSPTQIVKKRIGRLIDKTHGIIIIIIISPSVSIPDGGLKIDENDWKGTMLSPCSQGPAIIIIIITKELTSLSIEGGMFHALSFIKRAECRTA